jgi:hypothetical protein
MKARPCSAIRTLVISLLGGRPKREVRVTGVLFGYANPFAQ